MKAKLKKNIVPLISSVVLGSLCIIALFSFLHQARVNIAASVAQDLRALSQAFEKIESDCGILSFDAQKNVINFLNVGSFAGSEVGPMNLRYPDNWKGPYLADNPTVQGIEYQVVSTVKGYFITPGDGVKLPNGKVIGTDIKLDEYADIAAMMFEDGVLLFDKKSLAAPVRLAPDYNFVIQEDY